MMNSRIENRLSASEASESLVKSTSRAYLVNGFGFAEGLAHGVALGLALGVAVGIEVGAGDDIA